MIQYDRPISASSLSMRSMPVSPAYRGRLARLALGKLLRARSYWLNPYEHLVDCPSSLSSVPRAGFSPAARRPTGLLNSSTLANNLFGNQHASHLTDETLVVIGSASAELSGIFSKSLSRIYRYLMWQLQKKHPKVPF